MNHREYLDTARRHLTTCRTFFDNVNWEITPPKEELLKDWVRQLEKKESFYERKVVFLRSWIALLMKENSLIGGRKKRLQEKYTFLEKNVKKLEDITCSLKNSVMWLSNQGDLVESVNNSSEILIQPLTKMTERLSGDITWCEEQRNKLKKEKESFERETLSLEKSLSQLNEERDRLRGGNGLLEETKKSLDQFVAKFTEQTNRLEEQENQLKKLRKTLKKSESDIVDCGCKLEECAGRLEKFNAIEKKGKDGINQQWMQLEKKKNLLENDIGGLKKQLKGIDKYITWLESQEKLLKIETRPQDDLIKNELVNKLEEDKAQIEQNKNSLKDDEKQLNENETTFQKKVIKHKEQLKKKEYLLKDIYYLTGYILEALTIFAVYEGTTCGFDGNTINGFQGKKITDLDIQFTKGTHIDYYKVHEIYEKDNDAKWKSNRNLPEKPSESDCDYEEKLTKYNKTLQDFDSLNELITELKKKERIIKQQIREKNGTNHPENSSEDVSFFHNVESHHFYEIITGVLNDPKIENRLLKKDEVFVPLLAPDAEIRDKKVMTLIQKWHPKLRYSDRECKEWQDLERENVLQKEPLGHLIELCEDIFDRISKLQ